MYFCSGDTNVNITYLSAELQKRLCVTGSEGNYTSTVGEFKGQPVQFGTAFDAGKVKVIQEVKEGTNEAAGTATLNGDQLMVVEEGKFNVTLTYTKADGTQETYNAGSFDVEALTTKPELLEYLAGGEDGDGTTTWEWNEAAGAVWGNGPFGSGNKPQWWAVNYGADIDGQGSSKVGGVARNGNGAWFTIDINNKQAIGSDGVKLPISVSVLEHKDPTWDKGTISFPTATNDNFVIPLGVNVNAGNAVFQKYYVLVASDDKLVLTAAELPENGNAWFYVFKKKAK